MKFSKSSLIFSVFIAAAHLVSAQTVFNPFPSRIVGQPFLQQVGTPTAYAPNLVEGREMFAPQGIAVDNSANPPILYVADFGNNRVLAWRNALGFQKGDPADLVIGQRDKYSTGAKGPGTDLSTGLNQPTGLLVDSKGNLYVADSGNNRILRFPQPLQQTTQLLPVDLILGQKDANSRTANQGLSSATDKTLSLSNQYIGMAIDSSGNLWVADGNNSRILRYPVSALGTQPSYDPAADLVLGQPDFVTSTIPKDFNLTSKGSIPGPGALAFSPSGLLFAADSATGDITVGRVLVYAPPFSNGQPAARVMGVRTPPATMNTPPPTALVVSQTSFNHPNAIFFIGDSPFIVDSGKNRILEFDPYTKWPSETTSFSPLAVKAFGQSGWELPGSPSDLPNAGNPTSTSSSFFIPTSAVMAGTDLLVSDTGNNRVIAIPQFPTVVGQSAQFPFFQASRVVGQLDFQYNSINLIDGREVAFSLGGGGAALDLASATLHLYVADANNHRVLGFKDARTVQPGQTADLVIGQPDFLTAIRNYPTGAGPSSSNLFGPEGVAVDSKGDLWVADTGNGRVLRFPKPFDQPATSMPQANLVIGQATFTANVIDASAQTMKNPYAIAFTANGDLVASDVGLNRVLYFHKIGPDFVNGQAATNVIGQPDFQPSQSVEVNPLSGPRGVAVDPNFDRLYIADTGNNRVLVYPNLPTAQKDPSPSLILTGFNHPVGVAVDQGTGELWVADTGNNRIVRYPSYDVVSLGTPTPSFTLSTLAPVALTLDAFGNPVVAEGFNRIGFYYHAIGSSALNCADQSGKQVDCSGNAANYFSIFAPGMLATIKPSTNGTFGTATVTNNQVPLPTTLGDIQVLVGGKPAPLLYVSPRQINFQVPSSTPIGSLVEFDVVQVSTSQTLAAWLFKIDPYAPGLFALDGTGSGQAAALNQDGTINGPSHPAKAGTTIQLFGTGQGVIPGGPADGMPATGAISTPLTPIVLINPTSLSAPSATVTYSGLAPGAVGEWQINAVVPSTVPVGAVPVVIELNSQFSSVEPFTGNVIRTTIYVTP